MTSTLSPRPNVSCEPAECYSDENATLPAKPIGVKVDVYLTQTLIRISFAFEIVSVVLVAFVLALSVVRIAAKTSVGPKIFAVNLLAFNLLYCLSSLLSDVQFVYYVYGSIIYQNTVVQYLINSDCLRSLTLLVFNASYLPFLAMFIVACLRPNKSDPTSTTVYYASLVLLSDVVPIALQVVNALNPPAVPGAGLKSSWPTDLYAYPTFTLYIIQVCLMVVSIWVVAVKSKQLAILQASPAQTAARRKELVKALYFAVGPCLIQLPVAVQLALLQVEKALRASDSMAYYRFAEVMGTIDLWVRISRAITPIVDALSILLFLGDYRRSARTVLQNIGRLIQQSLSPNNSVDQVPPNEAHLPV